MSDNKEYVSSTLENGTVNISDEVLARLTALTATEVEGVFGLGNVIAAKKSTVKGVRVVIDEEDCISIDCYVVALYGYSVVEVAKSVQEAVTTTLESTTGAKIANVNVSICGISQPRTGKK